MDAYVTVCFGRPTSTYIQVAKAFTKTNKYSSEALKTLLNGEL